MRYRLALAVTGLVLAGAGLESQCQRGRALDDFSNPVIRRVPMVVRWDPDTGQARQKATYTDRWLYFVCISPDGKHLTSWSPRGLVLRSADVPESVRVIRRVPLAVGASFSPDGSTLVTSCGGALTVLDVPSGKRLRTLDMRTETLDDAAFAPRDNLLVTTGSDHWLRWWNARAGKVTKRMRIAGAREICLAVSPDGSAIATGGDDRIVRLWHTAQRRLAWRSKELGSAATSLAFSSDGARLAAAGLGGKVHVWECRTGRLIHEFVTPESGRARRVKFRPHSPMLACGYDDGVIRLWSTETGRMLRELKGNAEIVWSIAFDPTGKSLYCAIQDVEAVY